MARVDADVTSSVLVVLHFNTDILGSSLARLHSFSHPGSGSGVALVMLCSITKDGS